MKIFNKNKIAYLKSQKGFSVPEIVIVMLILAIILVLALPQLNTSRQLFRYSGMKREIVTLLREARQEAMSQRTPITFHYKHNGREARIFGGKYGGENTSKNLFYDFDTSGLTENDIEYGRPLFAPTTALSDGVNLTDLDSNNIKVTFQPDGSVLDASGNPEDFALFFFHKNYQKETAFAVSILGAGGRVKLWNYSPGANEYVE